MKRGILSALAAIFVLSNAATAQMDVKTPLWSGEGRIVVSSDGNEHDWDDWAATPMTLALLSSQKLQDKLALYTYSDHIWGSSQGHPNTKGMSGYEHMRESALGGAEMFGFDKSRFVCAVDNAEVAYTAMCNEINKSSQSNPLFIIGAGPMQVIGEGLNRADADKLKYVTVISHSNWNNKHSDNLEPNKYWDKHEGWTFDEMIETFGDKVNFVQICDQNHGNEDYIALQSHRSNFDWMRVSEARQNSYYKYGSWDWLYGRLESCAVKGGTHFDVSDSGMVVFLLTGEECVTPDMLREMMESVSK